MAYEDIDFGDSRKPITHFRAVIRSTNKFGIPELEGVDTIAGSNIKEVCDNLKLHHLDNCAKVHINIINIKEVYDNLKLHHLDNCAKVRIYIINDDFAVIVGYGMAGNVTHLYQIVSSNNEWFYPLHDMQNWDKATNCRWNDNLADEIAKSY